MGWGNGVVDWGMQSATLNLPINQSKVTDAAVDAAIQACRKGYMKEINRLVGAVESWKDTAIEVQSGEGGLDEWVVSAKSWKSTAMYLRENFAPHLSPDDVLAKYKEMKPIEQKKYYRETSSKRTWDK